MSKAELYNSKEIDDLFDEMQNESWFKKFMRWLRVQLWIIRCRIFNRPKRNH